MKKIDTERYLWLLRAFGVLLGLLVVLNLVLLLAFDRIAPGEKLEAFFVQAASDSDRVIYVASPAEIGISKDSVGEAIAKNYIMKYVIDRESRLSSRARMEELIGPVSDVYYMSAPELYRRFAASDDYASRIGGAKEIASVSINSDEVRYLNRLGYWEVPFTLAFSDKDGLNRRTEKRRLEIEASFDRGAIERAGPAKWRNPLGFRVARYEYAAPAGN